VEGRPVRVVREWGSVILSFAALLTGGAALFIDRTNAAAASPLVERIAKVEQQQANDKDRLGRIEDKLDKVLARIPQPGWQDSRGGR
jgi:hypothetical protein